jgi:hypothetical protein
MKLISELGKTKNRKEILSFNSSCSVLLQKKAETDKIAQWNAFGITDKRKHAKSTLTDGEKLGLKAKTRRNLYMTRFSADERAITGNYGFDSEFILKSDFKHLWFLW